MLLWINIDEIVIMLKSQKLFSLLKSSKILKILKKINLKISALKFKIHLLSKIKNSNNLIWKILKNLNRSNNKKINLLKIYKKN